MLTNRGATVLASTFLGVLQKITFGDLRVFPSIRKPSWMNR